MAETPRNRRDFIFVATGAVASGGLVLAARPMIKQMSPAADSIAEAGLDIDVSLIAEGQDLRVLVRGKPVLIRHRTPEEIQSAVNDDEVDMIDPATDLSRLRPKPDGSFDVRFLVIMPICTHFGSIVISQAGRFDGFYCPSHGAHFDTSGRARTYPASRNMTVPPYYWVSDTVLRLQFLPVG